ncbi:hypothetical protein AWC38_SpisGene10320 [Stylophora pistillata]|uniref:Uncharacterized protein n=1 Tax=Stylophora pistillata TaxID=50429 RepID=A0A2B4S8C6_STYPI|nr:hypothetical protein AWC38_SpisGene10320 [Stylophora pistillata]
MSRKCGGRGLRSVETTYKDIKIKAAMKLYGNPDPCMEAVGMFQEKSVRVGRHSVIMNASKYAEEMGLQLKLEHPEPTCITEDGKETQLKPLYENERAVAYWDIPLYADGTHVKATRIDASIVDKENKKVSVIEMSCPWVENREEKAAEKTAKY